MHKEFSLDYAQAYIVLHHPQASQEETDTLTGSLYLVAQRMLKKLAERGRFQMSYYDGADLSDSQLKMVRTALDALTDAGVIAYNEKTKVWMTNEERDRQIVESVKQLPGVSQFYAPVLADILDELGALCLKDLAKTLTDQMVNFNLCPYEHIAAVLRAGQHDGELYGPPIPQGD